MGTVFRRRNPRTYRETFREFIYPRGGFRRAGAYLLYRLRRLPDPPHRIARGLAAGVFLSFSPLYGFHVIAAALIAALVRGNLLAAFLGTFFGNPLTMPFIALGSVGLGQYLLGQPGNMTPQFIISEFARATGLIWENSVAWFSAEATDWGGLTGFFEDVFLPYTVGGAVLGAIAATIVHVLTVPLVRRYQRRRAQKMAARIESLRIPSPTGPDTHTRSDPRDMGGKAPRR